MLCPMTTCGPLPRARNASIDWITTLTLSSIRRSWNFNGLGKVGAPLPPWAGMSRETMRFTAKPRTSSEKIALASGWNIEPRSVNP
jgi:hypothetical protein